MSRWKWHEKPGVRKGCISRKSDFMSAEEEQKKDHERHEREYESQPTEDTCPRCGGAGGYGVTLEDGSTLDVFLRCEDCDGTGHVLRPSQRYAGRAKIVYDDAATGHPLESSVRPTPDDDTAQAGEQ